MLVRKFGKQKDPLGLIVQSRFDKQAKKFMAPACRNDLAFADVERSEVEHGLAEDRTALLSGPAQLVLQQPCRQVAEFGIFPE